MLQLKKAITRICLICIFLAATFCTFTLLGKSMVYAAEANSSSESSAVPEFATLEELDGKPIGVLSGSTFDLLCTKHLPNSPHKYFPTSADIIFALQSGKVDGSISDLPVALEIISKNPHITMQKKYLETGSYGYGINKQNPHLLKIINEGLVQLKADGTKKKLEDIWFGKDESKKVLPEQHVNNPKGVIKALAFPESPPLSYVLHNKPAGYETAILILILNKAGYQVDISFSPFESLIASVVSGKSDLIYGAVSITEERKKQLLFSDPTYEGGDVMLVRVKNPVAKKVGWLDSIKESFAGTFIKENRYITFLSGLKLTLLMSLGTLFLGTLFGFCLWLLQETKKKYIVIPIRFYVSIMEGIPVPVLLMIFFYIIFGDYQISPLLVGILAFSLNFAVYVSEILTSGITSIDKGQWEAAKAMGFTRTATFIKFIFPQALAAIVPVYIAEGISVIKLTSVAGYITIIDLTKASDIIRSRTFEPFFPLIVTALLYILIAVLFTHLLRFLGNKFNPQKRARVLKGVRTNE